MLSGEAKAMSSMAKTTCGLLPLSRLQVQPDKGAETFLHQVVEGVESSCVSNRRATSHGVREMSKASGCPQKPQSHLRIPQTLDGTKELAGSFDTGSSMGLQVHRVTNASTKKIKIAQDAGLPGRCGEQIGWQLGCEGCTGRRSNDNGFAFGKIQRKVDSGRSLLELHQRNYNTINGPSEDTIIQIK